SRALLDTAYFHQACCDLAFQPGRSICSEQLEACVGEGAGTKAVAGGARMNKKLVVWVVWNREDGWIGGLFQTAAKARKYMKKCHMDPHDWHIEPWEVE